MTSRRVFTAELRLEGSFTADQNVVGPWRRGPNGILFRLEAIAPTPSYGGEPRLELSLTTLNYNHLCDSIAGTAVIVLPCGASLPPNFVNCLTTGHNEIGGVGSQNWDCTRVECSRPPSCILPALIASKKILYISGKALVTIKLPAAYAEMMKVGFGEGQSSRRARFLALAYFVIDRLDDIPLSVVSRGGNSSASPMRSFPHVKNSRAQLGLVGIINQGATCYLNGLLQGLFHIRILRKLLYETPVLVLPSPVQAGAGSGAISLDGADGDPHGSDVTVIVDGSGASAFTCALPGALLALEQLEGLASGTFCVSAPFSALAALQQVFFELEAGGVEGPGDKPCPVSTKGLTKAFGWDSGEQWVQQDVDDMFMSLLDALETRMEAACAGMGRALKRLFELSQLTRITAQSRNYSGAPRLEHNVSIKVPVHVDSGESPGDLVSSLRACVFSAEVMDGDNQYELEKGVKVDAVKTTELANAPPLLMMNLVRFVWDRSTGERKKDLSRFAFPEVLDVAEFLPRDDGPKSAVAHELHKQATERAAKDIGRPPVSLSLEATMRMCNSAAEAGEFAHYYGAPACPPPERVLYRLQAVLVHSGFTAGSGHYYAYVRPSLGRHGVGMGPTPALSQPSLASSDSAGAQSVAPAVGSYLGFMDDPVCDADEEPHRYAQVQPHVCAPFNAAERAAVRYGVLWQQFTEKREQLVDEICEEIKEAVRVSCPDINLDPSFAPPSDKVKLVPGSALWSEQEVQERKQASSGVAGASDVAGNYDAFKARPPYCVEDWCAVDRSEHHGWFKMNDETVTPVCAREAVEEQYEGSASAYCLMYVREDALPNVTLDAVRCAVDADAARMSASAGAVATSSSEKGNADVSSPYADLNVECALLREDGRLIQNDGVTVLAPSVSALFDLTTKGKTGGEASGLSKADATSGNEKRKKQAAIEVDDESAGVLASLKIDSCVTAIPKQLLLRISALRRHARELSDNEEARKVEGHAARRLMLHCTTQLQCAANPFPSKAAPVSPPSTFSSFASHSLHAAFDALNLRGSIAVPGPKLSEPQGSLYKVVGESLGLPPSSFRLWWCCWAEGYSLRLDTMVPFNTRDAWAPPYAEPEEDEAEVAAEEVDRSASLRGKWHRFKHWFDPPADVDQDDAPLANKFRRRHDDCTNTHQVSLTLSRDMLPAGTMSYRSGPERNVVVKGLTAGALAAAQLLDADAAPPWYPTMTNARMTHNGTHNSAAASGDVVMEENSASHQHTWNTSIVAPYGAGSEDFVHAAVFVELLQTQPLMARLNAASVLATGGRPSDKMAVMAEASRLHPVLRRLSTFAPKILHNAVIAHRESLRTFAGMTDTFRIHMPKCAELTGVLSSITWNAGVDFSTVSLPTDVLARVSYMCVQSSFKAANGNDLPSPCGLIPIMLYRYHTERPGYFAPPAGDFAACNPPVGPLSFLSLAYVSKISSIREVGVQIGRTLGLLPLPDDPCNEKLRAVSHNWGNTAEQYSLWLVNMLLQHLTLEHLGWPNGENQIRWFQQDLFEGNATHMKRPICGNAARLLFGALHDADAPQVNEGDAMFVSFNDADVGWWKEEAGIQRWAHEGAGADNERRSLGSKPLLDSVLDLTEDFKSGGGRLLVDGNSAKRARVDKRTGGAASSASSSSLGPSQGGIHWPVSFRHETGNNSEFDMDDGLNELSAQDTVAEVDPQEVDMLAPSQKSPDTRALSNKLGNVRRLRTLAAKDEAKLDLKTEKIKKGRELPSLALGLTPSVYKFGCQKAVRVASTEMCRIRLEFKGSHALFLPPAEDCISIVNGSSSGPTNSPGSDVSRQSGFWSKKSEPKLLDPLAHVMSVRNAGWQVQLAPGSAVVTRIVHQQKDVAQVAPLSGGEGGSGHQLPPVWELCIPRIRRDALSALERSIAEVALKVPLSVEDTASSSSGAKKRGRDGKSVSAAADAAVFRESLRNVYQDLLAKLDEYLPDSLIRAALVGVSSDRVSTQKWLDMPPVLLPLDIFVNEVSGGSQDIVTATTQEICRRLRAVVAECTRRLLSTVAGSLAIKAPWSTAAAHVLSACDAEALRFTLESSLSDFFQQVALAFYKGRSSDTIDGRDNLNRLELGDDCSLPRDVNFFIDKTQVHGGPLTTCHVGPEPGIPWAWTPYHLIVDVEESSAYRPSRTELDKHVDSNFGYGDAQPDPVAVQVHWTGLDALMLPAFAHASSSSSPAGVGGITYGGTHPTTFILSGAGDKTFASLQDRIQSAVGLPSNAFLPVSAQGWGLRIRTTVYRVCHPDVQAKANAGLVGEANAKAVPASGGKQQSTLMGMFAKKATPTLISATAPAQSAPVQRQSEATVCCPLLVQPLAIVQPSDTLHMLSQLSGAMKPHGHVTATHKAHACTYEVESLQNMSKGDANYLGTSGSSGSVGGSGRPPACSDAGLLAAGTSPDSVLSFIVCVVDPIPSWEPSFPDYDGDGEVEMSVLEAKPQGVAQALAELEHDSSLVVCTGYSPESRSGIVGNEYRWLAIGPGHLESALAGVPPILNNAVSSAAIIPRQQSALLGRVVLIPVRANDRVAHVRMYARMRLGLMDGLGTSDGDAKVDWDGEEAGLQLCDVPELAALWASSPLRGAEVNDEDEDEAMHRGSEQLKKAQGKEREKDGHESEASVILLDEDEDYDGGRPPQSSAPTPGETALRTCLSSRGAKAASTASYPAELYRRQTTLQKPVYRRFDLLEEDDAVVTSWGHNKGTRTGVSDKEKVQAQRGPEHKQKAPLALTSQSGELANAFSLGVLRTGGTRGDGAKVSPVRRLCSLSLSMRHGIDSASDIAPGGGAGQGKGASTGGLGQYVKPVPYARPQPVLTFPLLLLPVPLSVGGKQTLGARCSVDGGMAMVVPPGYSSNSSKLADNIPLVGLARLDDVLSGAWACLASRRAAALATLAKLDMPLPDDVDGESDDAPMGKLPTAKPKAKEQGIRLKM